MMLRPTIDVDLERLSKSISDGDLKELRALSKGDLKITILEALQLSVKDCECYTIADEFGAVYAVGGTDEFGCAWFITASFVRLLTLSEKREFYELLARHRDYELDKHYCLWNLVHKENRPHIKLLEKLGAIFFEAEAAGDFYVFKITRGG